VIVNLLLLGTCTLALTNYKQNWCIICSVHETTSTIPDHLRTKLECYMLDPARTRSDKLSRIQRAYVKHALKEYSMQHHDKKNDIQALARQVVSEGVRDRIWTSDFKPHDVKDMTKYMNSRVKNELRRIEGDKANREAQKARMISDMDTSQ
jgi:hypothetical protein